MPLTPNDIIFSIKYETDMPPGPDTKLLDIKATNIWLNSDDGVPGLRRIEKHLLNTLKIWDKDTIEFKQGETRKVHRFPTNHVTIKQFIDAVIDFEKIYRPKDYPGYFNWDHNCYEGIYECREGGVYSIIWGS